MKSLTATSQADPSVAKTYRVEDIAKILEIGRSSADNLVREGHFKTVRIGTAIRISRKSFDEWLESQAIYPRRRMNWYGIYCKKRSWLQRRIQVRG